MAQKTGQKTKLVEVIARGATATQAAKLCGISRRTVCRRLKDAEFCAEVTQARQRLVDAALGKLSGTLRDAAATFRALLNSESDSVKLAAARSVLEFAQKMKEHCEFEKRLLTLEEILLNKGKSQ